MKSRQMKITLYLTVLCLLSFLSVQSHASPSKELKKGEFFLDIRDGQKVDLISNKAELKEVLEAVSKKTGAILKFDNKKMGEVTVNFKNKSLGYVLKKILGKNSVLIYKNSKLVSVYTNGKSENLVDVNQNKVLEKNISSAYVTPEKFIEKIKSQYAPKLDDSVEEIASKNRKMYLAISQKIKQELPDSIKNVDLSANKTDLEISSENSGFLKFVEMLKANYQPLDAAQ